MLQLSYKLVVKTTSVNHHRHRPCTKGLHNICSQIIDTHHVLTQYMRGNTINQETVSNVEK